MSNTYESGGKTPATGCTPVASGTGLGVTPVHSIHVNVRKAVEDLLLKATKEAQIRGKWVYYGSLGRINVYEARARNVPTNVRPGWRRFTENVLISMRIATLTIMRRTLEIESILKEHREKLPIDVYRQLILAIGKMRFEALMILKDIDERLFNVEYAIYDVI
jgi:hypothetical protein